MENEYYIQNKHAGYLGNAIVFWSKEGGYTADLNKAKRFPKEEARAIKYEQPDKWAVWRVDYIDSNKGIQRIVDSQYLDKNEVGLK